MAAPENTEAMRRARRADSDRKRRLVLAVTDAQLEAGRHPTIAGIARQAGVGPSSSTTIPTSEPASS